MDQVFVFTKKHLEDLRALVKSWPIPMIEWVVDKTLPSGHVEVRSRIQFVGGNQRYLKPTETQMNEAFSTDAAQDAYKTYALAMKKHAPHKYVPSWAGLPTFQQDAWMAAATKLIQRGISMAPASSTAENHSEANDEAL